MKLFKVYFSTHPHVPVFSSRYLWAKDLEQAKASVQSAYEKNLSDLEALDFRIGSITQEDLPLFEDYVESFGDR